MGEGVFIGPESSGHPAKVAYVQYLSTVVQRLSHMSRYYPEGILNSSVRPILLGVRPYTIHRVWRTICQRISGGPPAYVHQKVAYVRGKGQEAYIRLT
jgi:hypothetical protein